ncbi:MAG: hypothetical protein ACPIOQ_39585 [Promethearchaeia archaeon]
MKPAMQRQFASLELARPEVVFAGQVIQTLLVFADVNSEYFPAGHRAHETLALARENLPASQSVHATSDPFTGLNLPATQGVQDAFSVDIEPT